MRKHETAVCGTARTVVWEVGKCENRRQMPFMISIYLLPDYRIFKNKEGCSPTEWRVSQNDKKVLHSYECNTFLIGMQHFLGECDTFFERKTLYLHHERNI